MKFFSASSPAKVIFVILPGNPGKPGLYIELMKYLHVNYNKQVDIYCIAYVGHDIPTSQVFDLGQQVEHSRKQVIQIRKDKPNAKIYLFGHSVGAYIALQLEQLADRLVYMFPSIDDFKSTPNAKIWWPLFTPLFIHVFASLVYLSSYLPSAFRQKIAMFADPKLTEVQAQAMTKEWDPRIIYNAGKIVQDEFEFITPLDLARFDLISTNKAPLIDKCYFILSPFDDWCDISTYRKLATRWPGKLISRDKMGICLNGGIYLTDAKIPHAFCVGFNKEVADIIHTILPLY